MDKVTHPKRKRKSYTAWSLEARAMLRELYEAHASIREMEVALNRPAANIRAMLSRMGLKLSDRKSAPNRTAFDTIMAARGVPPRYLE